MLIYNYQFIVNYSKCYLNLYPPSSPPETNCIYNTVRIVDLIHDYNREYWMTLYHDDKFTQAKREYWVFGLFESRVYPIKSIQMSSLHFNMFNTQYVYGSEFPMIMRIKRSAAARVENRFFWLIAFVKITCLNLSDILLYLREHGWKICLNMTRFDAYDYVFI